MEMYNLRILQIHTKYRNFGGEDTTVFQEKMLLSKELFVDTLIFENRKGFVGASQFLFSICNIYAGFLIVKKIVEFRPDIVHIHNWHFATGPIVIIVSKIFRKKVVITLQNFRLLCPSGLLLLDNKLFVKSVHQKFPWSAVLNKAYRNSLSQTFWLAFVIWFHKIIGTWNKVDKYICLTSFAVELYTKSTFGVAPNKFTVKPNFTYLEKDVISANRGDHFLFVGRLSEEKGIKLLLDVFMGVSIKLKIAGTGPLEPYVLDICKRYENIEYLGNLKSNEVRSELGKCSALIFPSIWYEGMPLTIIEAFAASTPVIASNLGAMSSMIVDGENGMHFISNDSADLKGIIQKWENLSSNEKSIYCENAFSHYTRIYSPEKQFTYLNDIYQDVVKQ